MLRIASVTISTTPGSRSAPPWSGRWSGRASGAGSGSFPPGKGCSAGWSATPGSWTWCSWTWRWGSSAAWRPPGGSAARTRGCSWCLSTAYADQVFDGYSVGALGYLLKPPKPEQLDAVLGRARRLCTGKLDRDRAYVCRSGETQYRVPMEKILYFASDRRQVHCVTAERRYTFYGKLDAVAAELGGSFIRVHQRYLVRARGGGPP